MSRFFEIHTTQLALFGGGLFINMVTFFLAFGVAVRSDSDSIPRKTVAVIYGLVVLNILALVASIYTSMLESKELAFR